MKVLAGLGLLVLVGCAPMEGEEDEKDEKARMPDPGPAADAGTPPAKQDAAPVPAPGPKLDTAPPVTKRDTAPAPGPATTLPLPPSCGQNFDVQVHANWWKWRGSGTKVFLCAECWPTGYPEARALKGYYGCTAQDRSDGKEVFCTNEDRFEQDCAR